MPVESAAIRAEQLETLSGIIHQERTGKKFTTALKKLIDIDTGEVIAKELHQPQIAALKEWRRDYLRQTALPKRFVEEFAKLQLRSRRK